MAGRQHQQLHKFDILLFFILFFKNTEICTGAISRTDIGFNGCITRDCIVDDVRNDGNKSLVRTNASQRIDVAESGLDVAWRAGLLGGNRGQLVPSRDARAHPHGKQERFSARRFV